MGQNISIRAACAANFASCRCLSSGGIPFQSAPHVRRTSPAFCPPLQALSISIRAACAANFERLADTHAKPENFNPRRMCGELPKGKRWFLWSQLFQSAPHVRRTSKHHLIVGEFGGFQSAPHVRRTSAKLSNHAPDKIPLLHAVIKFVTFQAVSASPKGEDSDEICVSSGANREGKRCPLGFRTRPCRLDSGKQPPQPLENGGCGGQVSIRDNDGLFLASYL